MFEIGDKVRIHIDPNQSLFERDDLKALIHLNRKIGYVEKTVFTIFGFEWVKIYEHPHLIQHIYLTHVS